MDLETAVKTVRCYSHLFISAYIFGSVSRGEEDEYSDVDLILVMDTDLPFFERIRAVLDLRYALERADLIIYTPEEIESMLAEEGRQFLKDAIGTGYHIEGKQNRSSSVASTG